MEYHTPGGNITVRARLEKKGENNILIVTVEDDAPGMPEFDRKRLESKYENGVSIRSDGTDLEYEAITILVSLLQGELMHTAFYGQRGNKTVLHLPYLTQEEIDKSDADAQEQTASNVVDFKKT